MATVRPSSPSQQHKNTNARRAYTKRHQSTMPSQAADPQTMYISSPDSAPVVLAPLPVKVDVLLPDETGPVDDSDDYPFTLRQAALLQAFIRWSRDSHPDATGDTTRDALLLCQSVGYHPHDLQTAQGLMRSILGRIDAMEDTKRAMRLFGMGFAAWSKKVFQIANCGSPRVEVIAAKLWGLAMGVFDDPAPSAGAKVIIESAHESPDGARTATRVTLDPTSSPTSGDLVFAAAKPKVAQKRRKMLNKTE